MNEDANAEVLDNEPDQQTNEPEVLLPESSPGQEEQPVKKTDNYQKRINELTAKRYAEQRRADELEAKLNELETSRPEVAAPQVSEQSSVVNGEPQFPADPYDDEAVAKYHKDMVAYNRQIAEEAAKKAFQDSQQTVIQAEQQAKERERISTWASNAIADGVEIDKLKAAENILIQESIDPVLGKYIMDDVHGGKIAAYLLDNPTLRHEVLSLDPVSAGIKIATEVKPQALSTTPKVSSAPDPLPEINGGGAIDKDDFARKYPGTEFI